MKSAHRPRRFRNIEPASRVPVTALFGAALAMVRGNPAGAPPGSAARVSPRTSAAASSATALPAADRAGAPALPVESPDFPAVPAPFAVTWLGHASVLIELDGYRILADPMLTDRASPVSFAGPRRLHRAPLTVDELPQLDAIVISHDHYDHFDKSTIAQLSAVTRAPILVPTGLAHYARRWVVPGTELVELPWGGEQRIGDLTVVCTPARHFSGRGLRRDRTLWASWTLVGPKRRVFFGGDTGYTPRFGDIGAEWGPFDLTALPIGAYDRAWPDIHMTPEQAVLAHNDLRGGALLPIHWASFNLARHPWAAPMERLLAAVQSLPGSDRPTVLTPAIGRRLLLPGRSATDVEAPVRRAR